MNDCHCEERCDCGPEDCRCEYVPQVCGTLDGLICNYGEAYRMASITGRPLVCCVGQSTEAVAAQIAQATDAVVCIACPDEHFVKSGVYCFEPRGGRLLQVSGPPIMAAKQPPQTSRGRWVCGPAGCRYVD